MDYHKVYNVLGTVHAFLNGDRNEEDDVYGMSLKQGSLHSEQCSIEAYIHVHGRPLLIAEQLIQETAPYVLEFQV